VRQDHAPADDSKAGVADWLTTKCWRNGYGKPLARRDDAEEKRMFGGLCFMVGGRMCCGVHKSHLILRLPGRSTSFSLGGL
jgi:TfoX N-terminal domain